MRLVATSIADRRRAARVVPLVAILAGALTVAAPSGAQPTGPQRGEARRAARSNAGPQVGVLVGLNSATFGGADRKLFGQSDPNRRNAAVAGLHAVLPLGAAAPFALRPEVLYAARGARAVVANGTVSVLLTYVDVPVLVQTELRGPGATRVAAYAGPSVAFRTGCRLGLTSAGVTARVGCANNANNIELRARRVDAGVVVGGELARSLGARTIGVGVRYTHGITSVFPAGDVKNRVVAVYGRLAFPVARGADQSGVRPQDG